MSGQPETMQEYIARQIHEPCKKRERELEADLASLRASHQEVIRVVREWRAADKALRGMPNHLKYAGGGYLLTTQGDAARTRLHAAESALAAIDLGGAE